LRRRQNDTATREQPAKLVNGASDPLLGGFFADSQAIANFPWGLPLEVTQHQHAARLVIEFRHLIIENAFGIIPMG